MCATCGGVVTAFANRHGADRQPVVATFPRINDVDSDLPDRAKSYLKQATESLHAPSGAVMLAASAVDAMLKAKGYASGSLYTRIAKAIEDHVLTEDMGKWAHAVRLDANDERHADESSELPTNQDAKRCIDFVTALGQFLFTLPARVQRGIAPPNPIDRPAGQ